MSPSPGTSVVDRAVAASNALTARWIRTIESPSFVASGACVWPLLAALADGAAGNARDELEEAIGLPAADGLAGAAAFFDMLEWLDSAAVAIGVWLRDSIVLDPDWAAALPAATIGRLTGDQARDRVALDAWVREFTKGILDRMPVELGDDVRMVLATALAVRFSWAKPFTPRPFEPGSGPWTGRRLEGLSRTFGDLHRVAVADTRAGAITTFVSEGDRGIDVHLVGGPDGAVPGEVLAEAIAALAGERNVRRGSELSVGERAPGLEVVEEGSQRNQPRSNITTVAFEVTDEHDLTETPDVFGLRTAMDCSSERFPGVSTEPLCVQEARQLARARFTALGFEAAAVTAVGMPTAAAALRPPFDVLVLNVTFDRPFGFLAVDRVSGLVVFAGWVTDPLPWTED